MSRFLSKITCCTNDQKNLCLNQKTQSTDTNNQMTQMLELSDNDFKALVTKMLEQEITKTLETTGKKIESLSRETESFGKENSNEKF